MENTLYERYEKIRDLKGYTDYKVAKIAGIKGTATISNWKNGKYTPKEDKMQKIADVLEVPLEYLMGKTDIVICPICGFGDNPLSKQSSNEHDLFHAKFMEAKKRYPFLMNYSQASYEKNVNIAAFRDLNATLKDKERSFQRYLEASFSIELCRTNYDFNLDYDHFSQMEVRQLRPDNSIPQELIDVLADKYGASESVNDFEQSYYVNADAREMAQFMFENPEYKALFDASRKVSKEDIETVKAILDKFKSHD